MKTASIRDLRYDFKKVERMLQQGDEVQITMRRRVIARLTPENSSVPAPRPDFMARLHKIYGADVPATTGAELIAEDRDRR